MAKNSYSPTEVGTLIESVNTKLTLIAEEVSGLSAWRPTVDKRLQSLEQNMTVVKDTLRISIPELYQRVSKLEFKTSS